MSAKGLLTIAPCPTGCAVLHRIRPRTKGNDPLWVISTDRPRSLRHTPPPPVPIAAGFGDLYPCWGVLPIGMRRTRTHAETGREGIAAEGGTIMKRSTSTRATAVAISCAIALGTAFASAGSAQALDTDRKPQKADFSAAARALDVVEDAILLGTPLPRHDPAIGDEKVRLSVTTPGYRYTPWFPENPQVMIGAVDIRVAAKGVAPGPLTVWVKAGGHACVPRTSSLWQKVTIPNGGTFSFALKNKWYSTAIFLRVSDVKHNYRYESITVRVGPKSYEEGNWTLAEIVSG